MKAISITMDSVFPLKLLVINKSKDTRHKSVTAALDCKVFHWI